MVFDTSPRVSTPQSPGHPVEIFDAIPNRSGIHVVLDLLTVPDHTRRSDSGRADAARRTDLTAAAGRTTAVPSIATTATAGPAAGRAADVVLLNPGNATRARFC